MAIIGCNYEFGPFVFKPDEMRLYRGEKIIKLYGQERDILLLLVQNPGRIMERNEIYKALWPDTYVEDGNISKLIYLLRKKLGGQREEYIEMIIRVGYRFVCPVKPIGETDQISRKPGARLPAATLAGDPSFELFAMREMIKETAAMLSAVAAAHRNNAIMFDVMAARFRDFADFLHGTTPFTQNAEVTMLEQIKDDELRAQFVSNIAEKASRELSGVAQGSWLNTLESIHDSLIATLDWYNNQGRPGDELKLAVSIGRFWDIRGRYVEGQTILQRALARQPSGDSPLKAQGLAHLGGLFYLQGNHAEAKRILSEGVKISRSVEDMESLALSSRWAATIAEVQGRFSEAKKLLSTSLKASEDLDAGWIIAWAFSGLGSIAEAEEDCIAAKEYHSKNLSVSRDIQHLRGMAKALSNLGVVASKMGDVDEARQHLEQSLSLRHGVLDYRGIADCYLKMGLIEEAAGRQQDAETFFRKSLAIRQKIGDRHGSARATEGIGRIRLMSGDDSGAVLAFGAADAMRASIGVPLSPSEHKKYGHAITDAKRKSLPTWTKGREKSDDIIASIITE